jgi:hypothetical protein
MHAHGRADGLPGNGIMTRARKTQNSPDDTWLPGRLAKLASIFAIDVCVYVVVPNHYCILVRADRKRALRWSAQEVVRRWSELVRVPTIVEPWLRGDAGEAERDVAECMIHLWRHRLCDVGSFMASLDESMARRSNEARDCTSLLCESRLKCLALLDEQGLLRTAARL